MLRAMAEKLIPGIPHATRIAILQQTDDQDDMVDMPESKLDKTVLEAVLSSDETRNDIARSANCKLLLSLNLDGDD